ncbi:hypothetical protein GQ457_12G032020 [Hibiscus cannabinus]
MPPPPCLNGSDRLPLSFHRFSRGTSGRSGFVDQSEYVQRSEAPVQKYSNVPIQDYSHVFSGIPSGVCVAPYNVPMSAQQSHMGPSSSTMVQPSSSSTASHVGSVFPMSANFGNISPNLSQPTSFPSAPSHPFCSNVSGSTTAGSKEVVWYPDSGATHHITNDRSNLHYDAAYTGMDSLLMGNGSGVHISHVGVGVVSSGDRLLSLHNLLCVPDIKKNLLSVSQFARDNGVFFEFHSHTCFVKDAQTKVTLLEGRLTPEGLYEIRSDGVGGCNVAAVTANKVSGTTYSVSKSCLPIDLWHKRLGHPSLNVLKSVLSSCNLDVSGNKLSSVCVPCLQGKAHKLPFELSTTEYVSPFQLIVSDVWGSAHELPTHVLRGKSLYEVLYKQKPDYGSLRVFGCACFPLTRPFNQYKLDFRTKRCVFLGYSSQHKGYKCLSDEGKIIISRHVVFDENVLPMVDVSSKSASGETHNIESESNGFRLFVVSPAQDFSRTGETQSPKNTTAPVPINEDSSGSVSVHKSLGVDGSVQGVVDNNNNNVLVHESVHRTEVGSDGEVGFTPIGISHPDSIHASSERPFTVENEGSSFYSLQQEEEETEVQSDLGISSSSMEIDGLVSTERVVTQPIIENLHPMITRGKSGIRKPKVFNATVSSTDASDIVEPQDIHEAFQDDRWRAAAQQEYDALLKNNTWSIAICRMFEQVQVEDWQKKELNKEKKLNKVWR